MSTTLIIAALVDLAFTLVVAWAIVRTARATEATAAHLTELRKQAELTNAALNRLMATGTVKDTADQPEPGKAQRPIPGTPW